MVTVGLQVTTSYVYPLLRGLAQTESNGPTRQLEVTLFAVNSAFCVHINAFIY